ncbi:uncharacterized protein TNCV_4918441 [Trichonephila clavipes]|nr:uncharacterized protein TNCV_4918441 [Trichonephila clavipes]
MKENLCGILIYSSAEKYWGCGSKVVKVSVHGWHVMRLSPVPLKTRRVGVRCMFNMSRAQTSSRCCGVVNRRGVPTQVSSLSLDHGSKLRGPSQNALIYLNSATLSEKLYTNSAQPDSSLEVNKKSAQRTVPARSWAYEQITINDDVLNMRYVVIQELKFGQQIEDFTKKRKNVADSRENPAKLLSLHCPNRNVVFP